MHVIKALTVQALQQKKAKQIQNFLRGPIYVVHLCDKRTEYVAELIFKQITFWTILNADDNCFLKKK